MPTYDHGLRREKPFPESDWKKDIMDLGRAFELRMPGFKLIRLPDDRERRDLAEVDLEFLVSKFGGESLDVSPVEGFQAGDRAHLRGMRELLEAWHLQNNGSTLANRNLLARNFAQNLVPNEADVRNGALGRRKQHEWQQFDLSLFFRLANRFPPAILLKFQADAANIDAAIASASALLTAVRRITNENTQTRARRPTVGIAIDSITASSFARLKEIDPWARNGEL